MTTKTVARGGWARLGCTLGVFLVSAWLNLVIVFVLFGFNPGGSATKNGLWKGAMMSLPTLLGLLLGYSLYYWWKPGRYRSWLVTVILMAACPFWFPVGYGIFVECVTLVAGRGR